jgi:GT2 family glycosyltransferase
LGRRAGDLVRGAVALPRLSVVIPHWPIDEEVNDALRRCVASLPPDCERIVVVNEGTGFARNVNLGLTLATGEYVAVIGNDSVVRSGDLHELCVPETVASPVVVGKPGVEPNGFHGACWVAPREVLERVGLLDERFEGAFFEDDDFLARLREAGVPRMQVASVTVESRRIGLTMSKIPQQADHWYHANQRRFAEKWGWVPAPTDPGLADEPEFKNSRA